MQEQKFPRECLPLRKGATPQTNNVAENTKKKKIHFSFVHHLSKQPYIVLPYTGVDSSVYFLLS